MTFNINNQQAGIVNNVAGDQTISGGQSVDVDVRRARAHVQDLRQQIKAAGLPAPVESRTTAEIDGIEEELAHPKPDPNSVAKRLHRVTELLVSAGAFLTAGTALGAPIMALSGLLGVLGAPIRHLLDR